MDQLPPLPPDHRRFLDSALPAIHADPRILGVTAGGSLVQGGMDENSDLDLIIVASDAGHAPLMASRIEFAADIGPILKAFTGEHTGDPRLIICLYDTNGEAGSAAGNNPLHVDLKFVNLAEFASRVEEPAILFDRDGSLARVIASSTAVPPPDRTIEWIDERYWTWIHYTIVKVMRGETYEGLSGLSWIRELVLGPLALRTNGHRHLRARGVRRIEAWAPQWAGPLKSTLGAYDTRECLLALQASVEVYQDLRRELGGPEPGHNPAEPAVIAYLGRCIRESNQA